MTIYTSTKVVPYVYLLTHRVTGEIYIGSRTTSKLTLPPHLDLPKYKTSAPKIREKFDEFDWMIVAEFFDPSSASVDAYDFEQYLIHTYWGDPLLLNRACYHGKKRFNNTGSRYQLSEKTKAKIKYVRNLPEFKQAASIRRRIWFANPENKQRYIEDCNTPAAKKNYSEAAIKKVNQPEYIKKLSDSHHKYWATLDPIRKQERTDITRAACATPEYRENLSAMVKQKQWDTPEGEDRKKKFSEKYAGANNPAAKTYRITTQTGEVLTITGGLRKFCASHDLTYATVRAWIDQGPIVRTGKKDNSFYLSATKRKIEGWIIEEIK